MRGFLFFCLIISFTSCTETHYYSESLQTSENYTWLRSDDKTFKFYVHKTGNFNLNLTINYLTGMRWDTLSLQCSITGKLKNQDIELKVPIKDFYGEHIGEPEMDVWTTHKTVLNGEKLNEGEYTIRIIHSMAEDTLPYITEIGLELDQL